MKKFCIFLFLISFSFSFSITEPSVKKSISFTENKGQVSDQYYKPRHDILFSGVSNGMVYHLKKDGISYQLSKVDSWKEPDKLQDPIAKIGKVPNKTTVYRLDVNWLNVSKNAIVEKGKAIDGYCNYYLEVCPDGVTNVRSYDDIFYRNIYNDIDLHYYSKNGNLKYDYIVKPFADYKKIQLQVNGAEKITINSKGELVFKTPLGEIIEGKPIVYQAGKKLESKWSINNNVLGFEIEKFDSDKELIIDPITRIWGTFYGGTNADIPRECKTDQSGNIFVTGYTSSPTTTLIATTGSHQSTSSALGDAFLAKYDASGALLWGTYYGGNIGDVSEDCCIDINGDVYISGYTNSSFGIATPGSHQSAFVGSTGYYDAFLAKFNTNGTRIWGTYYGGSGTEDISRGCATDQNGNVYMCGQTATTSGTIIATPGSHQSSYGGWFSDAFVVKFDSTGVRQWGSYYGGTASDACYHCDIDPSDNIIIIGQTDSPTSTLIASPGCHQAAFSSQIDGFVAKFNSSGVRQWGTYYGGAGVEWAYGSATDGLGNVYLCGVTTTSVGSSVAAGGFQNAFGGFQDGFLVKFSPTGVRQWGTYYGGPHTEEVYRCCTDASNNVYLTGASGSSVTPVIATYGNYQSTYGGNMDAFLVKFNSVGGRQWGTYYGGTNGDYGYSCCVSNSGEIYLYGLTLDVGIGTIIASAGSQQNYNAGPGERDIFLARFIECNAPPSPANTTPTVNLSGCHGFTTSLSATGTGTVSWFNTSLGGIPLAVGNNFSTPTLTTGVSTTVYTFYAENTNSCSPSATRTPVNVTVYPKPSISFFGSLSICAGQSTTISAFGANTYSWNTGATTSTLACNSPSSTITYSVLGTSVMGCQNTVPVIVTVNPPPNIIVSSGSICVGDSYTITPTGASTYTYSSGSAIVSPTTNSSYSVSGTSTAGCVSATPAISNVTVNSLPVITVNSGTVCSGNIFIMSPGGASTYTYSSGSANVSPTVSTSYSVVGTSSAGCISSFPAISNITVSPNPTVTASSPTFAVCSGTMSCLISSGALTYSWTGPCGFNSTQQNPCFPFNLACTCSYSVTGTDVNGCKNTASVCITVIPNPTVAANTSNTLICVGQSATLTSNGANTYSWSTSATGSTTAVSPTTTTNYTVTGTDINGCTNSTSITQSVSACVDVAELSITNEIRIFPNPAKDQITISSSASIKTIKIVDVNGKLVLQKVNTDNSLSQTINISELRAGAYFIEVNTAQENARTIIVKE